MTSKSPISFEACLFYTALWNAACVHVCNVYACNVGFVT